MELLTNFLRIASDEIDKNGRAKISDGEIFRFAGAGPVRKSKTGK